MNILAIDVGGTNVKILATGESEQRRFASGMTMTPEMMVQGVKDLAKGWRYEMISLGYPGVIHDGQVVSEPHNLAPGWIGFDFQSAFGCPVKLMNDAAMQALGSYEKGLLLFIGLGTGLGSALVTDKAVVPMELGHLSYRDGEFEDFVGARGNYLIRTASPPASFHETPMLSKAPYRVLPHGAVRADPRDGALSHLRHDALPAAARRALSLSISNHTTPP